MKLIGRYLKPFILVVILCLGLLFVQAMSDLSLPNLMGDIVNVGIQQGGIEEGAPEAITDDGMKLLTYFMEEEDKTAIEDNYQYIMPQSSESIRYEERYPIARQKGIYVLMQVDEERLKEIDTVYANSTYALMSYLQDEMKKQETETENAEEGYADTDIAVIYQFLPIIEQMPEDTFSEKIEAANNTDYSMTAQVGVTFKKLFYKELGLDLEKIQSDYIWKIGLQMVGIAVLAAAAAIVLGFLSSRMAAKISKKMRHDVFAKVQDYSNGEFDKISTASLITRTTNDIQQVQMLITMGVRMLCYAPIMGIGSVIFAVQKSPSLSWIMAVVVLVMLGIILIALAIAMPKFKILQKLTDKLNLVSRESLTGMMVIRAFGNEKHEEKRFEAANSELSDTNLFVQKVMGIMMPAMGLIMNFTTLIIVWAGGHAIENATLQIGDMLAFLQYAMHIIMSFLFVAMTFVFVPRALVSANRINEVLDTDVNVRDPEQPKLLENAKGEITFKDVSFKYMGAEENVIENISFTAKPGETTAFIGSTGSGKSTLINLIPRFYDVTNGSIEIDGVDVRELSQESLRNQIGYIPQKGILFSGTIESNLRDGKEDATEKEMTEAITVAQAKGFVFDEGDGLNMRISQDATNVSGGQKQRLSIARALVKKPPIYIFDDSFSALDFKTDSTLRAALKGYTGNATVLIVAQRVSTIMNAEQIVVLDQGKIAGIGTHKELLKTCSEYREIAESQLQKEEL